ncbi:MAG TPA: hypothetical protein VNW49_16520 [Puia sp.]|nr:hypothetical protein [Puia sp.]
MLPEEICTEISILQSQIDENEKNFDIALQNPHQLELARIIYKNIKMMEGRIAELRIHLNKKSGPD